MDVTGPCQQWASGHRGGFFSPAGHGAVHRGGCVLQRVASYFIFLSHHHQRIAHGSGDAGVTQTDKTLSLVLLFDLLCASNSQGTFFISWIGDIGKILVVQVLWPAVSPAGAVQFAKKQSNAYTQATNLPTPCTVGKNFRDAALDVVSSQIFSPMTVCSETSFRQHPKCLCCAEFRS